MIRELPSNNFRAGQLFILVDSFFASCRVLGRKIELCLGVAVEEAFG